MKHSPNSSKSLRVSEKHANLRHVSALALTDVPTDDASHDELCEFAVSFSGYQVFDDTKSPYTIQEFTHAWMEHWKNTGELPDSIVVLRGCLFFAQRIIHWAHDPFEEDWAFMRATTRKIRELLESSSQASN